MIPFQMQGRSLLLETNDSSSSQAIPEAGLAGATVMDHNYFERGDILNLHAVMPFGQICAVIFDGMSMHVTLVGIGMLASITRDLCTGTPNLDSNPTFFPNRIHNMRAEFGFPQHDLAEAQARLE